MKNYLVNSMLDGCNITDASSLRFVRNRTEWKCSHKWKFRNECGWEGETSIWKLEHNFCCCAGKQSADNYQLFFKLQFAAFAARGGSAGGKSNAVLRLNSWVYARALIFIAQTKGGFQYCTGTPARCLIHRAPVQPWTNHLTFLSPVFFTVRVVLLFLWGRQRI